jgi:hypothetical protein
MLSDVMQAARYGDLEDVQACLAQGTSVSSQDTQGRTGMYEFQVWLLNAKHSFIELQFKGIQVHQYLEISNLHLDIGLSYFLLTHYSLGAVALPSIISEGIGG